MELEFKIGSGVLPISLELVKKLYQIFKNEKSINIYLVDESKSSKLKIRDKRKGITKHEISALILALRNGIEVNESNYFKTFKQIRAEYSNNREKNQTSIKMLNKTMPDLKEIIKKILNNEISLIESYVFFDRSKII